MQVSVFENPTFAYQQVSEDTNKVDRRIIYAFLNVAIVGTNQCIAEIPGVFGKHFVVHFIS